VTAGLAGQPARQRSAVADGEFAELWELGREEDRGALREGVGTLELGVLRFKRVNAADSSDMTAGRLPASTVDVWLRCSGQDSIRLSCQE
jgi:hypothetical protein